MYEKKKIYIYIFFNQTNKLKINLTKKKKKGI